MIFCLVNYNSYMYMKIENISSPSLFSFLNPFLIDIVPTNYLSKELIIRHFSLLLLFYQCHCIKILVNHFISHFKCL